MLRMLLDLSFCGGPGWGCLGCAGPGLAGAGLVEAEIGVAGAGMGLGLVTCLA